MGWLLFWWGTLYGNSSGRVFQTWQWASSFTPCNWMPGTYPSRWIHNHLKRTTWIIVSNRGYLKHLYGGYLEMPQKAFEGGILHVTAYAIFPEMRQNRTYSFSVLFSFSNWSRVFFSKCPTFLCSFFLKCPVFPIFRIRWENGKNCICFHVQNTSFKGFLGHFKIPPVNMQIDLAIFLQIFYAFFAFDRIMGLGSDFIWIHYWSWFLIWLWPNP